VRRQPVTLGLPQYPKVLSLASIYLDTKCECLGPSCFLAHLSYSVALHSNPAQFYPSCLQVSLSGSGTNYPDDADTVAIPGLFNDFVWPDIWGESFSFTIPGPPVISFDGSANTASSWSTPAAQATASVGVIGTNGGGGSGAAPTDDGDDGDYGTTTTAAKKGSATSPASAPVLNSKPKCVAKSNPALVSQNHGIRKRLAAALTGRHLRLSFSTYRPVARHHAILNPFSRWSLLVVMDSVLYRRSGLAFVYYGMYM
jgi:hypothetical protein